MPFIKRKEVEKVRRQMAAEARKKRAEDRAAAQAAAKAEKKALAPFKPTKGKPGCLFRAVRPNYFIGDMLFDENGKFYTDDEVKIRKLLESPWRNIEFFLEVGDEQRAGPDPGAAVPGGDSPENVDAG